MHACMPARCVQPRRREAWWARPTALCNCAGATILRRMDWVKSTHCTSYWNKNVWSDGRTQSYCTTFFCQEFCQAEVHKDTAFPHVPFNNLKVFWLERCPLAPVTMQNNCLMFHIQLCKAIRGIRWHEILRRQENNSNCRIALEGNCCFLIVWPMHKAHFQIARANWYCRRALCKYLLWEKIRHLVPAGN